MSRRVDPGHDPNRFYHCDCIQGGYDEHANLRAENERLCAENRRLRAAIASCGDECETALRASQVRGTDK